MKEICFAIAQGFESTHILMISESVDKIRQSKEDIKKWMNKKNNSVHYNAVYICKCKQDKLIDGSIFLGSDIVVEVLLEKK